MLCRTDLVESGVELPLPKLGNINLQFFKNELGNVGVNRFMLRGEDKSFLSNSVSNLSSDMDWKLDSGDVRKLVYSSPMASLVLTDSSQLTTDGFEKLPDQIIYPYAEPYDLQKHEVRIMGCPNEIALALEQFKDLRLVDGQTGYSCGCTYYLDSGVEVVESDIGFKIKNRHITINVGYIYEEVEGLAIQHYSPSSYENWIEIGSSSHSNNPIKGYHPEVCSYTCDVLSMFNAACSILKERMSESLRMTGCPSSDESVSSACICSCGNKEGYSYRKCTHICMMGEWKSILERNRNKSKPDQDSNLNLPVISSQVYSKSSTFDHTTNKADSGTVVKFDSDVDGDRMVYEGLVLAGEFEGFQLFEVPVTTISRGMVTYSKKTNSVLRGFFLMSHSQFSPMMVGGYAKMTDTPVVPDSKALYTSQGTADLGDSFTTKKRKMMIIRAVRRCGNRQNLTSMLKLLRYEMTQLQNTNPSRNRYVIKTKSSSSSISAAVSCKDESKGVWFQPCTQRDGSLRPLLSVDCACAPLFDVTAVSRYPITNRY
uniref:(California timema) hypothetical protein n=1 Tax=Timema californicum TaxID=61474 RepID=A0A7R9J3W7_TIMCA|nr:unnamed protein product [Timema californicum]